MSVWCTTHSGTRRSAREKYAANGRALRLRIIETISIDRIRAAAERSRPYVLRTPLIGVEGAQLKLECLQPTGSFKVRGFFAAALQLSPTRLAKGLITVSAGNAAQACAYVAKTLGVSCRVVMLDSAPPTKVEGVKRWGATPIPMPREELFKWMASEGWMNEPESFIHPFADEEVIAGHGGLGLELVQDVPDLERVVVPVGGGGLISGVSAAVKGLRPEVEVIGVQSDGWDSWKAWFKAGGSVPIKAETMADGTTAPFDPAMFERLKSNVDRWITVPEATLRAAVPRLAVAAKVVAEGAGALSYAALEQLEPGPRTVAVTSGGNIDPRLMAELLG